MHVVFLCNEYPPDAHGGIGSFTRTLARALARRGHRVTVVGYTVDGMPGLTHDEGVHVVRLPHARLRGTGLAVNGVRLRRMLLSIDRTDPIDVVEGPEASLAMCPRRLRASKVIRMHGGHHFFALTLGRRPQMPRSWLERRSFARATHLCAVSRYVATRTLEFLGMPDRPVEILPNPVDTDVFAPAPGLREEEGLIVFAGTVCEKKGVRQLLQAMPRVIDAVPQARLSIIGRDSAGPPPASSYTAWVRGTLPATIAHRVVFEGPVPHAEMPARLARAAVCVYPSHMEALPLAWLEGMSAGKCVVASRSGPGPEAIEDGVSGLLCDPHNPAAIAERLIAALTSAALRERLGRGARARVEALFSQRVIVERNEQFYERVCAARLNGRVVLEQAVGA